ncbi:MAG TPA: hypothetical protein VGM16_07560 [Gammaproteobacteria bacterium]|jgi:hypothetical protein
MFDSYTRTETTTPRVLPREKAPAAIFNGRAGFEAGATRLMDSVAYAASECAVLHLSVAGPALQDPAASRKTLGLVANILRARVKAGALGYLGDGRFAVLLQGVSGRDAVAFCRDALTVLEGIRLHWQGDVLTVDAWIGGSMAEVHHDGMTLLEAAEHAADIARAKPGRKLHMVHEQQDSAISMHEEDALPPSARTQTHSPAAFAAAAR